MIKTGKNLNLDHLNLFRISDFVLSALFYRSSDTEEKSLQNHQRRHHQDNTPPGKQIGALEHEDADDHESEEKRLAERNGYDFIIKSEFAEFFAPTETAQEKGAQEREEKRKVEKREGNGAVFGRVHLGNCHAPDQPADKRGREHHVDELF